MSVKEKAAAVVVVAGLFTGASWYFQPHSSTQVNEQQANQQVSDLSDSNEKVLDEQRRAAMGAAEADRLQSLRSVERRPAFRIPSLRVRW